MMIDTKIDVPISGVMLKRYFENLVNQVYKILPMREANMSSLPKYIWRLEAELIGGKTLVSPLTDDSYYGSLINILHYLNEHEQDCTVGQVKQLVFEAIHLCEKLSLRYADSVNSKDGD